MADKWWRRGLRPKHPYVIAGLGAGIVLGIVVLVALLCGGKQTADSVTAGGAQVPVSRRVTPGEAQPRSPKIIGGKPAKLPFIVSIQYQNKHRCQGSIVEDKFVYTTAQCVHGLKMKHLTLVMGRSNLDDEGGETRRVIDVTINSKWTPSHTDWRYDEAVLEMERPVVFGENIQPVCFADEGSVFPTGMKAAVYGWGNVGQSEELPPPRTLQGVNVTVTDRDTCNLKYNGRVTEDMLCTGNVAGDKDTCYGDVGAPLVVKQGDDFIQIGNVIRIPDQCAVPNGMETVSLKPSKTFIKDAIKGMKDMTSTTTPRPQCGKRNVPVVLDASRTGGKLLLNVPEMVPWMNPVNSQPPAPTPDPSDQICFKKYEG